MHQEFAACTHNSLFFHIRTLALASHIARPL
jgi:hypothetical protein